jgi:acyl-CoA synthetase (AMP-forming)/AMP-acid ligase II
MTIGNILSRNAMQFPEREALVFEGQRWTYRALNERVNRLANALLSLGLKKGDKVAMLAENIPAMVEANYALAKIGVIYFPVKTRLLAPDIQYLVDLSDASVLIFHDEFAEMVVGMKDKLPKVKTYIEVGKKIEGFATDYEKFLKKGSPEEPDVKVAVTDTYIFLCTGGTTGVSKLAMLTHENALWTAFSTINSLNLSPDDVGIQVLPLFHVIINNCLNTLMAAGAKVVLQHRFDPVVYMKNISEEKVTMAMVVPPFLFNWIMAVPEAIKYDVTHVRLFATAAATFPEELKKDVRKYMPKAKLFYTYGLTEGSGGNVTVLHDDMVFKKQGSIGVINILLDHRIVDDAGKDVKTGDPGELLIKGPLVFTGYYKKEEETKNAFTDGWFHTGDVVSRDKDGFVYFVDRKKDMIKTGGENVFAKEVEDAFLTHPSVQEAAVFGLPDPKWGEKIHAAIVLKPDAKLTEEELFAYAKEKLPGYKRPKVIYFVPVLPRNPSGKVLKYKMKEEYGK